jgi:hypothetical protein
MGIGHTSNYGLQKAYASSGLGIVLECTVTKWVTFFLLALGLILAGSPLLLAKGRRPPVAKPLPQYTAWAAYWDGIKARQAIFVNASKLEEVELFAYHFSADDTLVPAQPSFNALVGAIHQLPGRKPR